MWSRLELSAYYRLRNELPVLDAEWSGIRARRGVSGTGWPQSVDALIGHAKLLLSHEPDIAWRCYKAAARMMLHALEGEDSEPTAERNVRATEILKEASEKVGTWRGAAINEIIKGDESKAIPKLEVCRLLRAQRLLDEHHDNLHRKMKVLGKKLRVLETAGIAATVGWILLWPKLNLFHDANPMDLSPTWMACAVALMGLTGAVISGFSNTQGLSESRVPLQEAELTVMIGRLIFGTIAALAVVSFMVSGVVDLGAKTAAKVLTAAFASGFSERFLLAAVNSLGAKERA